MLAKGLTLMSGGNEMFLTETLRYSLGHLTIHSCSKVMINRKLVIYNDKNTMVS